jgi:hypothetical protein
LFTTPFKEMALNLGHQMADAVAIIIIIINED